MDDQSKFHIIISTGKLDDDNLVAEIYNDEDVYIVSVYYDGQDTVFDFTCVADNKVCKGERKINMQDFISFVNQSLQSLKLDMALVLQKENNNKYI